jgi:hypothetical protein
MKDIVFKAVLMALADREKRAHRPVASLVLNPIDATTMVRRQLESEGREFFTAAQLNPFPFDVRSEGHRFAGTETATDPDVTEGVAMVDGVAVSLWQVLRDG